MKQIKRFVGKFIFFMIIAGLSIKLFNYILVDDYNQYTRLTFHELFDTDENVDVLFLGSSHCMRSIDPEMASQALGMKVFNGGTAAQYNDASYEILYAASQRHELKKVFVEVFYGQIGQTPESRKNITATYLVSDYLPFSIEKVKYLLDASTDGTYVDSFFPARRNWYNFFNPSALVSCCTNKASDRYKNYDYFDDYGGNGYIVSDAYVEAGSYGHMGNFAPVKHISDYDKKYLEKIIKLCSEENIELYFFSAPMSDFRLLSLGNYDEYVSEMKEYLSGYGIPYWDFNLCRETVCAFDESNFIDDNHLNRNGASKLTDIMTDLLTGKISTEGLFYSSYAEKMANSNKNVYGVILTVDTEQNRYIINPIWKEEQDVTFTVYKQIDNGERILVMEGDYSRLLSVEEQETGTFEIHVFDRDEELLFTTIRY